MKFKVGDRVAVYGGIVNVDTSEHLYGEKGTVVSSGSKTISVRFDKAKFALTRDRNARLSDTWWVHPKQCRKLKKKLPRRVWIWCSRIGDERISTSNITFDSKEVTCSEEWVEFVEKKKKKPRKYPVCDCAADMCDIPAPHSDSCATRRKK